MYKTYITINKLNPIKCYIGMTGINKINYKGSGKYLLKAFKKYNYDNFIRIDLGEFNNKDDCHYWEGFYIKIYKTEKKYGGYNLSPTGGTYRGKHCDETKQSISNSKIGPKHPMYGKHNTKESNQKRSESNKGKHYRIVSEELKHLISEKTRTAMQRPEIKDKLKKSYSEERKQKLRVPHPKAKDNQNARKNK